MYTGSSKKAKSLASFSLKLIVLTSLIITQSLFAEIISYRNTPDGGYPNVAKADSLPSSGVVLNDAATGSQTDAATTTETIALPEYSAGDTIILIVSRNQDTTGWTGDANCGVQTLAMDSGRLSVLKITPVGTPASFSLTASTAGIWRWWIASFEGVDSDLPISATVYDIGNDTTAQIEVPSASLGFISSADDYVLAAAGLNATAVWTTDADTLYNNAADDNASLLVSGKTMSSADLTALTFAGFNRGNDGSARYECSLSLVLPAAGDAANLLVNPSFESGTAVATGWEDEHTTVGAAEYTLPASGMTDGARAQKIEYAGQAGDGSKILEIYQSLIRGAVAGDVLKFSVYLSGTLVNTPAIIGVEAFNSGYAYIDESDLYITGLSSTPGLYEVTYTCPAGTDFLAVYLQLQEVGATSQVSITLDSARLVLAPAVASITTTANSGNYAAGATVPVTVNFSKAVTSTGNVTVTLNTVPQRTCTFAVSNATSGSCTYVVQAGDAATGLDATVSGTIRDRAGNAMADYVPASGLSAGKTINIDAVAPAAFALVSPSEAETVSVRRPNFSWNASADNGVGLGKYQLFVDGSLNVDNIATNNVVPVGDLSCAAHTWFVKAVDSVGNATSSSTGNFTVNCGSSGSGGIFIPSSKSVVKDAGTGGSGYEKMTLDNLPAGVAKIAVSTTSDFSDISWREFDTEKFSHLNENLETLYFKFMNGQGVVSEIFVYDPQVSRALVDGDIVKTVDNPDVYIVKMKNNKRYKRLILSPSVFKSYGHLKWSNLRIVSQAELDGYTTSNLVKETKDAAIYELFPNGDSGERRMVDSAKSYDADSVYEINATDRDSYILVK